MSQDHFNPFFFRSTFFTPRPRNKMTEEDKPSLTPGETTKLELSDLEVPDNDIDPASSLKKEAKMEEEDHGHN